MMLEKVNPVAMTLVATETTMDEINVAKHLLLVHAMVDTDAALNEKKTDKLVAS